MLRPLRMRTGEGASLKTAEKPRMSKRNLPDLIISAVLAAVAVYEIFNLIHGLIG